MKLRQPILAGVAAAGLALLSSFGANAAVISSTFNQPLTATPVSISFNGVGSFLFSTVTTGYGPGAWVATSGTAAVTTLFGSVTDFFAGSSIDQTGELYTFGSYPAATQIPFSAADDFIGLQLTLADGVHYGYAEVDGPSLVGVGFQSTAGASILTGATGAGTGITLSTGAMTTTPEPASIALLATGLAVLSARRRRTAREVA